MISAASLLITLALATASALAQDYHETRALNAMQAHTRAEGRQSRALFDLRRLVRNRAIREGGAHRSADVLSQSPVRHD
jgi:hypothetical protein